MGKESNVRRIDLQRSTPSITTIGAIGTAAVAAPTHSHDADYVSNAVYAAHSANINAHHNEIHDVIAKHTASGLTTGHFLRANSSTTFDFEQITLGDIDIVGGNGIDVTGNTISVDLHGTLPYLEFDSGKLRAKASTNVDANTSMLVAADSNGRFTVDGITLEYLFSPTDTNLTLIPIGTGFVTTWGDLHIESGGVLYTTEVTTTAGNLTLSPNSNTVVVEGSLNATNLTASASLQVGGDFIIDDYLIVSGYSTELAANLDDGKSLLVQANSTDALRVDSTGDTRAIQQLKVGADTAPAYTLDVSGTARVSGNVYANNNLIVSGDVDAANADIPGTLELGTLTSQSAGTDLNVAANEIQFKSFYGTNLWKMLSDGTLRSNNFDAVTDAGWSIGPDGQNFGNVNIRGSLMTMVLEYQQMLVGAGRQLFRPGGKMHENLIINTTDGDLTYNVHLTDPAIGPEQVALVGDWLYIRGLAYSAPESAATGASIPYWMFVPLAASGAASVGVREAWMKVTGTPVYDTDHWYYPCTMSYTESDLGRYAWPAGTAVANRGAAGDGAVMVDSENIEGPFLDIHTLTETSGVPSIASHVRLGALRTASVGNAGEWGMIAAANLQSSSTSYLIASNQRLEMRNPSVIIKSISDETAVTLGTEGLILAAPSISATEYFNYYQADYHFRPTRLDTEINFSLDIDAGDQDEYNMASIYAERYDSSWWNAGKTALEIIEPAWLGRVAVEARKTMSMDILRNQLLLISKYQVSDDLWTSASISLTSTETSGTVTLNPTGNFSTSQGALVRVLGDVEMAGRYSYITSSQILRLYLKHIPLSSDGEIADVTGEPIDDWQVYRDADGALIVRTP